MEKIAENIGLLAFCVLLHGCLSGGSSRITMQPSVTQAIAKEVAAEINRPMGKE